MVITISSFRPLVLRRLTRYFQLNSVARDYYQQFIQTRCTVPWREDGRFLMSPPCLESQGCQFDPIFLYISSLVLLPSPVALSVLSLFCFIWPILLASFSLNLHFPKGRLFCLAFVFLFFLSALEMSTLVGGMCSICCQKALVLDFMHLYRLLNLQMFSSILFFLFFF